MSSSFRERFWGSERMKIMQPPMPPENTPPTSSPAGAPKRGVDIFLLKHYLHIMVRRIWLIAICFVIAVLTTVVMLVNQVPIYRATTTLHLSKGLPLPRSLVERESEPLGDYMGTQQRILNSARIIQGARERMSVGPDEVARTIRSVSIYPLGDTALIGITVDSLDAELGAEYANALAEEYLEFKAEQRRDTSKATVISLTEQAERLHAELKKVEEQARVFARENSVVAFQHSGNIAADVLGDLSRRAAEYRMERMLLEVQQPFLGQASDDAILMTLGTLDQGLAPGLDPEAARELGLEPDQLLDAGIVVKSDWESLKRQQDVLEMKLRTYRKTYRDEHPLIQETEAELANVRSGLELEVQVALREYYTRLESFKIKEQSLQAVRQDWEEDAIELSRKEQEYQNIQRSINRLQSLYDLIFNRLKEVDVSVGIEPESIRVMQVAEASHTPVTPRKIQSLFLAGIIGLGIGIALVFLIEFLDDTIKYPEEIAERYGIRAFGIIPSADWDEADLRSHVLANIDQQSGLAEAYRNLRSAFMNRREKEGSFVTAMISAVPREGKTTSTANMGVSMAAAGHKVLLIDGDLRRGSLHKLFGLEGDMGLSTVLEGRAKTEAVIQRTGIDNLDLMATGALPANPAEIVLRSERESLLRQVREKYEIIIIDCPPVMACSEASILASISDAVLMVIWAGHTSGKLVEQSIRILRDRGARIMGALLNNLELERIGYHYSSYYGYDYYYDSYRK